MGSLTRVQLHNHVGLLLLLLVTVQFGDDGFLTSFLHFLVLLRAHLIHPLLTGAAAASGGALHPVLLKSVSCVAGGLAVRGLFLMLDWVGEWFVPHRGQRDGEYCGPVGGGLRAAGSHGVVAWVYSLLRLTGTIVVLPRHFPLSRFGHLVGVHTKARYTDNNLPVWELMLV